MKDIYIYAVRVVNTGGNTTSGSTKLDPPDKMLDVVAKYATSAMISYQTVKGHIVLH